MSRETGFDHDLVGAGLPAKASWNLVQVLGAPSLASQLPQRVFVAHNSCRSRLAGDEALRSLRRTSGALLLLGVEDRGVFAWIDTIEVVVAHVMQAPADRVVSGVDPGVAPEAVEVPLGQR